MKHKILDSQKLYELASHPGTFPEMVQSTYHAGLEAGKEEGKKEREEVIALLRRSKRQIGWIVALILVMCLACLLLNCVLREMGAST